MWTRCSITSCFGLLLLPPIACAFLMPSPSAGLGPSNHNVRQMKATFEETTIGGNSQNQPISSSRLQSNRELLEEQYPDFPRTWVPLGSTRELVPDRPNRVEFLGQSYVAFFTNKTQEWVVMDNICPHRLAPLSEGRIEPETGLLQCSYHGWTFESDGSCQRIPQVTPAVADTVLQNSRACVPSYTTKADPQTGILWIWPWQQDVLSVVSEEWRHPEGMMKNILGLDSTMNTNATVMTYTRDLPYGFDTLVENLIDPAHIPFAHHGMQGKREDAIPINMTKVDNNGPAGFSFEFQDRTMGMMRTGTGEFRAPYVVNYDAQFEKTDPNADSPRPFRLSVLCVPTKPGWSRAIVFNVKQQSSGQSTQASTKDAVSNKRNKKKSSLAATIFKIIPTWVSHLLSNKFFDSDLAFLHYQEQVRRNDNNPNQRGDARYFMPAESDRSIAAWHGWMGQHAKSYLERQSTHLPPAIYDRNVLFDRWAQHTSHCKACQNALAGIQRWRRRSQWMLAASLVLGFRHWSARILALACLGAMKVMNQVETAFYKGEFKHYENH